MAKRRFIDRVRMAFNSLFFGMRGGDYVMQAPTHNTDDGTSVITPVIVDSIWGDLLRGEETQRVKELRDRYYRIYKESKNYKVSLKSPVITSENDFEQIFNEENRRVVKTTSRNIPHPYIDESDGLPIVVIQDAIRRNAEDVTIEASKKVEGKVDVTVRTDFDNIIFKIERDEFIPKMYVESYINRLVVKKIDDEHSKIDMYLPSYVRQFSKKDSIFKAEIEAIKVGRKSNIFDFKSLNFITYNAWGSPDICLFEFANIKFEDISEFDGSYVASFTVDNVAMQEDLTEKYKMEIVDEKYETMAPNHEDGENMEIDAIMRKIEKEQTNEDSNRR